MLVHDIVRQEMLRIYKTGEYRIQHGNGYIDFLDSTAKELFNEGLDNFKLLSLSKERIFEHNGYVYIVPWMGDKIVNTLTTMLIMDGYSASAFAGVIEVEKANLKNVQQYLVKLSKENTLTNTELAKYVAEKSIEKYDDYLPETLLTEGYGQKYFDLYKTTEWLKSI